KQAISLKHYIIFLLALACAASGAAQSKRTTTARNASPALVPAASPRNTRPSAAPDPHRATDPHRKFVLDVVKSAVALPQPDSQDRLRVLAAAVNVVAPVSPKYAQQLSREGVQLESEIVRLGQKPAVSIMSSGS